jgi:hypothetical protein
MSLMSLLHPFTSPCGCHACRFQCLQNSLQFCLYQPTHQIMSCHKVFDEIDKTIQAILTTMEHIPCGFFHLVVPPTECIFHHQVQQVLPVFNLRMDATQGIASKLVKTIFWSRRQFSIQYLLNSLSDFGQESHCYWTGQCSFI